MYNKIMKKIFKNTESTNVLDTKLPIKQIKTADNNIQISNDIRMFLSDSENKKIIIFDYSKDNKFLRDLYLSCKEFEIDNRIRIFDVSCQYDIKLGMGLNVKNIFDKKTILKIISETIFDLSDGDSMWKGRSLYMLEVLLNNVYEAFNGIIDFNTIKQFLSLSNMISLLNKEKFPSITEPTRNSLLTYLSSLPGYQLEKGYKQSQCTVDQHGFLEMFLNKGISQICYNFPSDEDTVNNVTIEEMRKYINNNDIIFIKNPYFNEKLNGDYDKKSINIYLIYSQIAMFFMKQALDNNLIKRKDVLYPENNSQNFYVFYNKPSLSLINKNIIDINIAKQQIIFTENDILINGFENVLLTTQKNEIKNNNEIVPLPFFIKKELI